MSRFPLFTDAHVRQQIVDGLNRLGWDVERAIDAFPEKTSDDVLFAHAARNGRVFVTNDEKVEATAVDWLSQGKRFTGLIIWKLIHHRRMSDGDFIRAFERLAKEQEPFLYPIVHIKPK